MSGKFTSFKSSGEAQKIEFALVRNKYTQDQFERLVAGDFLGIVCKLVDLPLEFARWLSANLAILREVYDGKAEIVRIERLAPKAGAAEAVKPVPLPMSIVVDCDANPKTPSGLYLTGEGTEHRKMGKITLEKRADGKLYANGKEVVRYLSPNQKGGKYIQGYKLRKELKDVQVLNACILDALLANPQLIPDEWKTGYTYFWGTIFRRAVGDLYVGCLYWCGGLWLWPCHWLARDWAVLSPAASLAS